MALTVKPGKTPLVFEYDDGEVSSSVKILPEDDQDALVRKLKRIVALVEGEQAQVNYPADVREFLGPQKAFVRPVAAEPPQLGPEQAANGWELLAPDDLDDAPGESG